jgi:hypothetical protein
MRNEMITRRVGVSDSGRGEEAVLKKFKVVAKTLGVGRDNTICDGNMDLIKLFKAIKKLLEEDK